MSLLQIIKDPPKSQWRELLARPVYPSGGLDENVRKILADIKSRGDKAVNEYSLQFDKVNLHDWLVNTTDLDGAEGQLDEKLKRAIVQAKQNITIFHKNQMVSEPYIETRPGIKCWRRISSHRKSWIIYSRRNSSFIFNTADVGNTGNTCRM